MSCNVSRAWKPINVRGVFNRPLETNRNTGTCYWICTLPPVDLDERNGFRIIVSFGSNVSALGKQATFYRSCVASYLGLNNEIYQRKRGKRGSNLRLLFVTQIPILNLYFIPSTFRLTRHSSPLGFSNLTGAFSTCVQIRVRSTNPNFDPCDFYARRYPCHVKNSERNIQRFVVNQRTCV